jgi:hypothetical protein
MLVDLNVLLRLFAHGNPRPGHDSCGGTSSWLQVARNSVDNRIYTLKRDIPLLQLHIDIINLDGSVQEWLVTILTGVLSTGVPHFYW